MNTTTLSLWLPRNHRMEVSLPPSSYWPTSWIFDLDDELMEIWDWAASSETCRFSVMAFLVLMFVYMFFNPILKMMLRYPLRKYAGMEFGYFKIIPLQISFVFKNVEILPVESPILKGLFAAFFPSAIVQPYLISKEYPPSKISIEKIKVGLRMRKIVDTYDNKTNGMKKVSRNAKRVYRYIFQRPIISIKLNGVDLEVEKAYISPLPPEELYTTTEDSFPSSVQKVNLGPDIPAFDQYYYLDSLRGDEIRDADGITYQIEQWIQHAKQSIEKFGDSANTVNGRTDDEKTNVWLYSTIRSVLHSISIKLTDASIIISGAGSEFVKETRKKHNPRKTNSILAALPKQRRALTVIGTDSIGISCSPDKQCNLVLSFAGLHVNVGNPSAGAMNETKASAKASSAEVTYVWHTIAHPFDIVIELKGFLNLIIWALSYDHHRTTRTLSLNLIASEIAVSMSPNHLQTALLHVDDFIDPLSSFNEWYAWLNDRHQQTLGGVDERDKKIYCCNYARMKKAIMYENSFEIDARNEQELTAFEMREMESRMTRYEIMSLRCIAMKNGWKIPKANEEFKEFLRSSQSIIMHDRGNESRNTPLDVLSPFQRLHLTPLHALAILTREKKAFLAPGISINFSTRAMHYNFPNESLEVGLQEETTYTTVSSTISLSRVSFGLEYANPLFPTISKPRSDNMRLLLRMSLQVHGMEWYVGDTNELDLPTFLDKSLVGIIYKQHQTPSSVKCISMDMEVNVTPTRNKDPLISLDLHSSDLVILFNPIPLLSALKTLIALVDIPFQHLEDVQAENGRSVIVSTDINARVENTSILFMTDRKDILRGVFDLEINELILTMKSCGTSGELAVSMPIMLRAGQIIHNRSSTDNGEIEWRTMPFKPIMVVDDARLLASGKEQLPKSSTDSHKESSEASTMCVNIEIGTEDFLFNASPSTLVAIIGFLSSLNPFLDWAREDSEEEERIKVEGKELELEEEKACLLYFREALREIFNSVDVDESGTLQEEEVERIVLMLFADNISFGSDLSQLVNGAQRLTKDELKRERDYLISIIDSAHTNQVSYQQIDSILFRMSQGIDDNNLTVKIGDTGVDYLDRFAHSTAFLSAPTMRKLVYFEDLREYAAMHEVYRITGYARHNNVFPAPSLWRLGEGIGLFWSLYTSETGCTSQSLNGQNISSVQRKLVRSLCNYQFARYCWKTLVQPQLHASCSDEGRDDNTLTIWLLDDDPQGRINAGVIDRLLKHVEQMAEDTKAQQKGTTLRDTHYAVTFAVTGKKHTITFGSPHSFTNPLFEAEFSHANINSSALVSSQTRRFVPEVEGEGSGANMNMIPKNDEMILPEDGGQSESEKSSNQVSFRGNFSVMYLNTKHDHLECLIEPYPCYGHLAYKTFLQDTMKYYGEDLETSSFTVNIKCPRSLSINALPAFFETVSMMAKIALQLDPETYHMMIVERDIKHFHALWDSRDHTKSGFLNHDEAMEVLHSLAETHWNGELAGLTPDELIRISFNLVDSDEDVSFHEVKRAIEMNSPRGYFTGCQEIQLKNGIGRELKVTQTAMNSYQSINKDDTADICINSSNTTSQYELTFSIERYKLIRGVAVSPYQSLMLPLIRNRKKAGVKFRKKKSSSTSGFSPYLTVVPKPDSHHFTLTVRACVTVTSDIPIRIRIVRLGKSLGYLKKRGTKSQIDLTKKNLMAALKRMVEGALIVYEKDDITRGMEAPLPLFLLESSHYHALIVQDSTGHNNGTWRDPVLLTKDFLLNQMNVRAVGRCHALSGIVIQKERLNICLPNKHHSSPVASDALKSILGRTAWDTTIRIVPFFLFSNSMPFPITARTWQFLKKEDDVWRDPLFLTAQANGLDEENISSDEDTTATPGSKGRGSNPDQFHLPRGTGGEVYFSLDHIERGETLSLSGINLRQPLYIQLSQRLKVSCEANETDLMWSEPLEIRLSKLRTGVNPRGSFALPKIPVSMGESCDCLLDVSVEGGTRVPVATLYSPFWIINKTGAKLEYKSGLKLDSGISKRYLDSGSGGLPIMIHCGKFDRELSVVPLESPNKAVALNWWNTSSNGKLVLKPQAIKSRQSLVGWSDKFNLETAGMSGEIFCGRFIFSVSIESLAGAFYRSNLITLAPRFVLKNMMHIPITILPVYGGLNDAIRKVRQLRKALTEYDERIKLGLDKNESTILYNFMDISLSKGIRQHRWCAFCVNSSRQGDVGFKSKWHLIPIDKMGSTYFGEHDGFNDTMCGIVEAKIDGSDGARVVSISHAAVPPFRIENRSNDHHIHFVQDDDDAVVFELPPMHSCGYTWDQPLGTKRLRAVVFPKVQSHDYLFEGAVEAKELACTSSEDPSKNTDGDSSAEETKNLSKDDDRCNKSVGSSSFSRALRAPNVMSRISSKRKKLFGMKSRSYKLSKIGSKKALPCPVSQDTQSTLWVHLRISAGTKVLSFNDSPWLIEQVELGLLRKGGDFKTALVDIKVDGLSLYLMDDFPREMLGVTVRDVQIYKPMGSIEATAKVRHFQVDAMLPNARYPIIIQPKLLGVDMRGHIQNKSLHETRPTNVDESECFWLNRNEGAPIFEVAFSYVPQSNMTWVPNVEIFICPMQLQLDVDYILRVVGMIMNSTSKHQEGIDANRTTTTHANDELQYITYGRQGSRWTYIEKLYIAPVWFEVEINLKPEELDSSESEAAGEASLTLNTIARSTNSAAAAGVLAWVVNVGANFAHVSPTFSYGSTVYTDRYCDIMQLARDIAISYIVQSIKQSYKVVFSMHLLGDPSLLAHQWRTGVSDLVFRTRDEVAAGGKNGVGKGFASFSEHVVGGSFCAVGRCTGGFAKTLDSLITTDLTSTHLKPNLPTENRLTRPSHALDGLTQGTLFWGKTLIHGTAGLLGDPYRGVKFATSIKGSMAGFTKGVASGVAGLVAAPMIGTLGFVALTSDGIGSTAKYLELGAIEARCRPARVVPWGRPMDDNHLSFMKAIGIRVHTVRYQKIRKCIIKKDDKEYNEDDNHDVSSNEYKRIRAAEERRKYPPRKVVNILYNKKQTQYVTLPTRPKLLTDHPGKRVQISQDHFAVCFEETIVLRSSDLQLSDEVVIQFRNSKVMKPGTTRSKPLGVCTLSVGDMYTSILHLYKHQLQDLETDLSNEVTNNSIVTLNNDPIPQSGSTHDSYKKTLIVPAPQEFSLFRPAQAKKMAMADVFEVIGEEIKSIREAELEAINSLESYSVESDSDSSFLGRKSAKEEDKSKFAKSNERLFGNISLSFFPVLS